MGYSQEVGDLYKVIKELIEKGSAFKVAGLFELGEATGKTVVSELLFRVLSIEAIGGPTVD